MLQLNDQHPAVHSIWVTKSRVIPTFPSFSTEFADPLIGDFRLIQVTNSEESTDEDLDVGEGLLNTSLESLLLGGDQLIDLGLGVVVGVVKFALELLNAVDNLFSSWKEAE